MKGRYREWAHHKHVVEYLLASILVIGLCSALLAYSASSSNKVLISVVVGVAMVSILTAVVVAVLGRIWKAHLDVDVWAGHDQGDSHAWWEKIKYEPLDDPPTKELYRKMRREYYSEWWPDE